MDDLPTEYDVIVIGTGMSGSIVAAAVSRIGKTVLHIDENDYYGEEWSSFNVESIFAWLDAHGSQFKFNRLGLKEEEEEKFTVPEVEHIIQINRKRQILNPHHRWFCPQSNEGETSCEDEDRLPEPSPCQLEGMENNENVKYCQTEWTQRKFKQEHRKFNLDLSPRMLYSRGSLVELLISSNIARYAEFKSVSRVLTWRDGRLELVPCSRADVFATKHVSIVQKRMLVKILSSFSDYPTNKEEFEAFKDGTFAEYLKHKKVDDQLIHYIVHAIAMGSSSTPCLVGVESCQKFLHSLGRFGNTPFIFPLYGSGEIPQCFCRLCAVFGGIYHLKRPVTDLITDGVGTAKAIVSAGKRLNAKTAVVISSSMCPEYLMNPDLLSKRMIYRAIYITNKSIAESDKESITLLQFPPECPGDPTVTVMEMGPGSQVCPPGLFVVHMTSEVLNQDSHRITRTEKSSRISARELFDRVEAALFRSVVDLKDKRPEVLWALDWEMPFEEFTHSALCPDNLRAFPGPDASIDYEYALKKAREIFKDIYPDEEFLPRAPDSDEIEIDYSDEPQQAQEGREVAEALAGSESDEHEEEKPAPQQEPGSEGEKCVQEMQPCSGDEKYVPEPELANDNDSEDTEKA